MVPLRVAARRAAGVVSSSSITPKAAGLRAVWQQQGKYRRYIFAKTRTIPHEMIPTWSFFMETAATLASSSSTTVDKLGSFDNYYDKDKIHKKPGDPNKRDFTYFVLGGARFIYASAARLVALKVRKLDCLMEKGSLRRTRVLPSPHWSMCRTMTSTH